MVLTVFFFFLPRTVMRKIYETHEREVYLIDGSTVNDFLSLNISLKTIEANEALGVLYVTLCT